MLTFQEIFLKLPFVEEQPRIKSRYVFSFVSACLAMCGCLLFVGFRWNNIKLIHAIWGPIGLMFLAVLAYAIVEGREIWKEWGKPQNGLLVSLDRFFADEKLVAAELAEGDAFELKCMRDRLEATLLTRERILDIAKPFSILVPALLVVTASDLLNFPTMVQNTFKVLGAGWLAGLAIGMISIYVEMSKLRRLGSTLQQAVSMSEKRGTASFRKVSRKRGVSNR